MAPKEPSEAEKKLKRAAQRILKEKVEKKEINEARHLTLLNGFHAIVKGIIVVPEPPLLGPRSLSPKADKLAPLWAVWAERVCNQPRLARLLLKESHANPA